MSTQALSAPISSLSLLLVPTQAVRWKAATPKGLTGVHLYLDIAKSGYLFHAVGNVMHRECPAMVHSETRHIKFGSETWSKWSGQCECTLFNWYICLCSIYQLLRCHYCFINYKTGGIVNSSKLHPASDNRTNGIVDDVQFFYWLFILFDAVNNTLRQIPTCCLACLASQLHVINRFEIEVRTSPTPVLAWFHVTNNDKSSCNKKVIPLA